MGAASRISAVLAGAAACALAGAAQASAFFVLDSTPDAVSVLDPAAAQTIGETAVRKAWTVTVKRVLTTGGPQQPGYVLTENEYDCAARQLRWRSFKVYSRFGDLVMTQANPDDAWTPPPRVGESAVAMRVVCDKRTGWSVISANSVSQLVLTLMQSWDAEAPMPPPQIADTPARKPAAKARPHKARS